MSYSNNYYSGGGGGGSSNNNRGGGGNNNNNNNGANYRSGGGGGYSSGGGSGGGGGYNSGRGGGGYNNQPSSGYNNNNNRGGGGGGGGGYSSRAPQQQQSYNNSRPQYGNNNQGGGGGYNQGSGGGYNNNNNRSAQQYGGGGNGGGYNSNSGGHRSDMRPQYAPSVPGGGASAYASRTNNNNTYGGGGGGGYNSGGGMGMGQRSTSSNNGPSGLEKVNCSKHNKQRLRKFCTEQAVYNADGEVLRMAFSCRDEDPCTTKDSFRTDSDIAAGDDNGEEATMLFGVKITSSSTKKDDAAAQTPVIDVDAIDSSTTSSAALMKIKPIITPTTPRTATSAYEGLPDSAANGRNASRSMLEGSSALGLFGVSGSGSPTIVSPTSTTTTAGGPQFRNGPVTSNRYYDLGGSNATEDRVENKKVCWQCGMSTHEKPNCKNTLCFTCHTHQEPGYNGKMNHQCVPVPPSSFVALDPALTGTFLSDAEVVAHNKHNDESFNDYRKEVERLQHESDDVVRERLQAVKVSSRSGGDNAAAVTPDDIMEDPSLKQLFMEPTEEERVLMSFGYLYHIPTKGDNTASLYHKAVAGGADEETPAAVCSGLLSTQCLRCHRFGHMDCPIEPEWKTPTTSRSKETMNCCYCLGVGHTGLSCTTRRRDIWRERAVQASIDQVGRTNVFTSPDDGQALGLVAPSRYPQQGSPTGGVAITSAYAASMQQRSTTTTTGVYNRRETFSVSDDEEDAFSSKLSKNRMGGQQPPQSSSSRRGRSYSSSSSYSRSPSSSSASDSDEYDPSKRSQKKMHSTKQFHQQPRGIPNRAGRASPPSRPQQHNNNNTYNNHSSSGGGGGGGHFNKRSRSGDFDNRPQHQSGGRRQEGPPQPPRGGMNRGGSNNNNNNRRAGGNFEF